MRTCRPPYSLRWRWVVPLFVTACLNVDGKPRDIPDISPAEASELLASYTSALATGDTAVIRTFWSPLSLDREGFWYLHAWVGIRLEVGEWPEFLERHEFELLGIQPGTHYHAIDIRWVPKGNVTVEERQPKRMLYYVIFEEGRWLLENPIDVLTHDWLTYETDCIRYRYPPNIDIENHSAELELMDRECERAQELLGFELGKKIEYFRTRTPEECGDLLLQPPAHGYAAVGYPYLGGEPRGFPVVVSRSFLHPHELMHVLHVEARIPSLTAVFSEGLATALGGTAAATADYALAQSANLMSKADRLSLRRLLTLPDAEFFSTNYQTYILAGGFFRFLLERYGVEQLTRLATETRSQDQFLHTIPQVYGVSVDEIETMWHTYLRDLVVPSLGSSVPPTADLVFSMTDQDHDDVGDGDYLPPERFEDGVFDLTKFEVLRDTARVYFRVGFRNVAEPVTYRIGGEQFFPVVVIAIGSAASDDNRLRQTAHGVRFEGGNGYRVKINVGTRISLCDRFGRVYFTTPDIWSQVSDRRTESIQLSLPIDLFKELEPDWRYFVGVGVASERAMDFIDGGPAPAFREHPVFFSGGNYDFGNPAFIDVLLPEGLDQVAILSDYDGPAARLAVVPMVGGLDTGR